MKVLLVMPNGEKIRIDADYWQFSQNKFVNEDIVLQFFKDDDDPDILLELESTIEKGEEKDKSFIRKPSPNKFSSDTSSFVVPLTNVIENDSLNTTRERYKIIFDDNTSMLKTAKIVTASYEISNMSANLAVDDMVSKEYHFMQNNKIKICKEPTIHVGEHSYHIEEEIFIEEKGKGNEEK
jgi:DNA polymerase IIIc chi subunit